MQVTNANSVQSVQYQQQGNINCKGTETFSNEPKLEKLLRELKPMPDLYYKKCRMPVMANLLRFGCFFAG